MNYIPGKWDYPGSRWWNFDFHVHSPASEDAAQEVTERAWLKSAMDAQLDCVVITDHNTGGWIDALKSKYTEIDDERPDWFRPLTIFPGMEITVGNSGSRVHLLAVFDPSQDSQKITGVLGACGITSGHGNPDQASTASLVETVKEIRNADGIAIGAHTDSAQGLLHNTKTMNGELERSLEGLAALEICDANIVSEMNGELRKRVESIAWVAGSDAHCPDEIGKHSCWMKMSKPGIGGLKLALMDYSYCLKHTTENPNSIPDIFVKSLQIENMKHCGRIPDQAFKMEFHPHFNAFIGGRGTGKSTALESIRIAARREKELATFPRLEEKMDSFRELDSQGGVMQPGTELQLEIHRRGKDYRLRWRQDGGDNVLEEKTEDGSYVPTETGDLQERFPMSIYSQKQIDALAGAPKGLLEIIDRAPEVNRTEWERQWNETQSEFMQLKERERQLAAQIAEEQTLKAQLSDIENDLKQYEEKGHGNILKAYQKRTQQLRAIPLDDDFDGLASAIREIADQAELSDFPSHIFGDDELTEEVREIHKNTAESLEGIKQQLLQIAGSVEKITEQRKKKLLASKWYADVQSAISKYNELVEEYESKQTHLDLNIYSQWVQKRSELQQRLSRINGLKQELLSVQKQVQAIFARFYELRTELFQRRQDFISRVLGDNEHVQMELIAYGDSANLENKYREILGLGESSFKSSVWDEDSQSGLLAEYKTCEGTPNTPLAMRESVQKLKERTRDIAAGKNTDVHGHFANRLTNLHQSNPAALDQLWCWWPEDRLEVKYRKQGQGGRFEDIERGSAGQRAAAILAFLLSYGEEPLLIDQPEDDLDTALIYNLVVKQIHRNKLKRQLVVITHNPNIVVNGDAELVHVLHFAGGQVQLQCRGGLEESPVRDAICNIMEGGREAFVKRYKRIMEIR